MKRIVAVLMVMICVGVVAHAQSSASGPDSGLQSRTLLVFPFENTSKAPGLEWIGEAFAEVLSDRMDVPGLYPIPRQDRVTAFDRNGLSLNLRPSRATLYRIAEMMDADYIVLGSYNYDGQTFSGTAQLLDVKRLQLSPEITEAGPLVKLLEIQTTLAWDLVKKIDPSYSMTREDFLADAPSVRLDAFENYIRGVVATSRQEKINKFREALRLNPQYTQAMLQLGKAYFAGHDYTSAASWFEKVPRTAPEVREATFYAGLSYYYQGDYEKAAAAFTFLISRFPLTEVYNNLGVAEARRNRPDALEYFQKAVDADPNDPDYRFNLGLAFYRAGNTAKAEQEVSEAAKLSPDDSEVESLLDMLSSDEPATASKVASTTPAAQGSQVAQHLPLERIKQNYDETSFRQLALEIQNATEMRLSKVSPQEHAAYHVEHGRDMLAHGFVTEATQELREAVRLDPNNADAHAVLAELLAANNPASARVEANEALRLKPSATAYIVLSRLDLRDNKLETAAQFADRALALEPSNADAAELKRSIAAKRAERTQPLPRP